jgi:Fic family protein
VINGFIHQRAGWLGLRWDDAALAAPLAESRYRQGLVLGRMQGLGFQLRSEATLTALTDEVIKSSAIEGERLDRGEVRSSIARRLGLDGSGLQRGSRQVEGVVEMTLDATQRHHEPLTLERLFAWHAALFPTGRSGMRKITVGALRTPDSGPMQVISGPVGSERIHFEAPGADRLDFEMTRFLDWFNTKTSVDPVLKAGVAHFWFVTIHPFEDGNGRIARAVADLALARADSIKERFYSMSAQIESERREYYLALESAQRGSLDITAWLQWFLGCLHRALLRTDDALAAVLRKAKQWDRINRHSVNERQRHVINRLLDGFEGKLTSSKYARLAKCSSDSALRDIKELLELGILVQNPGGGRSTSYRLAEPDEVG